MEKINFATKVDNFNGVRKRNRVINSKECQYDIKKELSLMFMAFRKAVSLYNDEISLTNPQDRTRGMEAIYFNSKLMQCLREYFGTDLERGKYGRMFLYVKGYIILFKKLNKYGMPMNIRTRLVTSIENQLEGNLFNGDDDGSSPIIFFGHSKSEMGEIIHPRLVYIDEERVRWTIEEKDILPQQKAALFTHPVPSAAQVKVKPKLKIKKKAE